MTRRQTPYTNIHMYRYIHNTCIHTYTAHVYILIQHMYTYLYSTCIRTYTTHVYIDIQHMYTQISLAQRDNELTGAFVELR